MGTALEGLDRAFPPTEWLPILAESRRSLPSFPPGGLLEHRIIQRQWCLDLRAWPDQGLPSG